jgi:hypothetical protein
MNNNHQSYPNVMWRPQEQPGAQTRRAPKRFSKAMARQISRSEALKPNVPRFRCPECNVLYSMSWSKFVRDTSILFSEPMHVCKDCATNPKYDLA